MKILHLLSQRPEATGSGIYLQAMIREAARRGHENFLLPHLPLVVLEALASGCRVVTTALPGVVEVLGGCDPEAILMVPRPRLLGQDTPHPEDEAGFVRDLAAALERQILAAREAPEVDRQTVAELLDYYSWSQVFARVEQVYLAAWGHGPH